MNPKRIALLRALKIGDFIVALPALFSLRRAYPSAEIVYLGRSWLKEYLHGRPSPVDRIEAVPAYPGVSVDEPSGYDARDVAVFFARMREEHFDLALQMHGGGKNSNAFLKKLGAGSTAGFRTPDAPHLDRTIPYARFQNETARCIELAEEVGGVPVSPFPQLEALPQDMRAAEKILARAGGAPFAVLHPGASDFRREWDPRGFARVGDWLSAQGLQVMISGSANERPLARTVAHMMQEDAYVAAGELSLSGFTGLLAEASIVISNDSGPVHLATALRRPTVGLFSYPHFATWAPLGRRWLRPLVSSITRCPRCGTDFLQVVPFEYARGCRHEFSFLSDIPVSSVISAAGELLLEHPVSPQTAAAERIDLFQRS